MASNQPQPPYSTYAALVGLFGAGMAGVGAVASLLQAGFAALTSKANELEQRTGVA